MAKVRPVKIQNTTFDDFMHRVAYIKSRVNKRDIKPSPELHVDIDNWLLSNHMYMSNEDVRLMMDVCYQLIRKNPIEIACLMEIANRVVKDSVESSYTDPLYGMVCSSHPCLSILGSIRTFM